MPTFSFIATDQNGSVVNGARVAGSRQELIARLRSESMVVTSVTEEAGTDESAQFARWRIFLENLTLGRIRQVDLMVVTRQLAAMLKAGVSLTDSLHTIAHSVEQARLHNILLQVRTDVQRGRSLSEALRRHPAAFDNLFISIVHAGETSGSLAQNVARLSDYLERREAFRQKLKSATAYPKFVVVFFTLLTAGIFLFILPRFQQIFTDFGAKLPRLTQIMMDISFFIRHHWFLLLLGIVGLVILIISLRNSEKGARLYDRLVLRIPFFGTLFLHGAVARLAMTLSTLLHNGIPLTDALQTAGGTLDNSVLEEGVRNTRREVMKGYGLAESFSRVPELPRLLPRMVRVGEESGTLSGMLQDVANYYDQEVDHALGRIAVVIEPILIIGMGALVLVTVLAIYLPIFGLSKAMRGGG